MPLGDLTAAARISQQATNTSPHAQPNIDGNCLARESAKGKRLEQFGADKLLGKLKPLGDVIDLKDASEVKKLAALVPLMKSADGGDFAPPNCDQH